MNWLSHLSDSMNIYYHATGIALTLLSPEWETLNVFGEECSYCKLFRQACGRLCPCDDSHIHACQEAARLMDGYIFSCPAGYIHFAVPVYRGKVLRASILAGPIALDFPDMALIDSVLQRFDLDISFRSKLYGAYGGAPLPESSRAHYLCRLLARLVSGSVPDEDNSFIRQHIAQDVQQARIGEYIKIIKDDAPAAASQYDEERQLIADVITGNKPHAKALLNEMIGRVYFTSGNNFEIIRARTIELVALLSRALVENGGDQTQVYYMTEEALHKIIDEKDLTGLSYTLLEVLDLFISMAFTDQKIPDSPSLQKAVSYINEHYFEPLSLKSVASHVGLNGTYFSTMFKRQMGMSFSDYLTQRRIKQAKVLLKNSNMSLMDISLAVGFENQSYFSRVFRDRTGVSPRQYRERAD